MMVKVDIDVSEFTSKQRSMGSGRLARQAEMILEMGRLLRPEERALLDMYYDKGNTIVQLARVAGISESAMSARLHKVTRKLVDGDYYYSVKYRDRLTILEQLIARDYFLDNMTLKGTADKRKTSVRQVRKAVAKVRKLRELDRSISSGR